MLQENQARQRETQQHALDACRRHVICAAGLVYISRARSCPLWHDDRYSFRLCVRQVWSVEQLARSSRARGGRPRTVHVCHGLPLFEDVLHHCESDRKRKRGDERDTSQIERQIQRLEGPGAASVIIRGQNETARQLGESQHALTLNKGQAARCAELAQ